MYVGDMNNMRDSSREVEGARGTVVRRNIDYENMTSEVKLREIYVR